MSRTTRAKLSTLSAVASTPCGTSLDPSPDPDDDDGKCRRDLDSAADNDVDSYLANPEDGLEERDGE